MALVNPLFSHNGKTPLFFMNGNAVTLEAVAYGAAMGVMVAGVLLWCKCYSILMTSDKFVYLVGRAMPKLAVVLSSALRYVPALKRQAGKVQRTQRAMGWYTGRGRPENTTTERLSMKKDTAMALMSAEMRGASRRGR